jgi:hypothetical protein
MNEEALKYSYELFVQDGYNGTFDDYKKLMNSDQEAFKYSHDLFKNDGYDGDINKFSELLNMGKTPAVVEEVATVTAGNNQATGMELLSVDGSSESVEVEEPKELRVGEKIKLAIDATSNVPGMEGAGLMSDLIGTAISAWSSFGGATVDLKKGGIDTITNIGLDYYMPNLDVKQKTVLKDFFIQAIENTPLIGGFLETEKKLEKITEFGEDLEVKGGDYDKTISENLYNLKIGTALHQTTKAVIDSSPSVAMAFMGPGGMMMLGASSAGSHYEELSEARPDERGGLMFSTALAQGGIEMVSEIVTRGIAGRAMKAFAGQPTKEVAKGVLGMIAKDAFFEGLSEVASTEANNIIDERWGINRYYNDQGEFDYVGSLQRMMDTFFIGSLIGGGITGVSTMTGNQTKLMNERLAPTTIKEENIKLATEINKLSTANKEQPSELVTKKIKQLQNKLAENKMYNGLIIQNMSSGDKIKTAQNVKSMSAALNDIKNNPGLSDLVKDTRKLEIEALEKENNKIYYDTANAWEISQKEKLKKKIKRQIDSIAKVDNIVGEILIDNEAIETTYRNRLNQLKKEGVRFAKNKEGKEITIDQLVEELKNKKGENLQYYKKDGTLTQEIFVNEKKALEQWDGTTGSHEILHGVFGRAIGTDPKLFKASYDSLKKYLNKNNSKLVKQIDADLKTKGYETIQQYEEFFNAVSDKMIAGEVSYDKTLGDTLLQFFNKIMKPFTGDNTFTDGRQAFNFLQDFSKAQTKGNLSRAAKGYLETKAIGEGAVIKSSRALVESGFDPVANKQKIDNLLKENLEIFNKSGEAKGKLTQDIAKEYLPLMKYYATRSQPKTGKSAFSTLDGFNMQDYLMFAETELALHIANFNPEVNDSLDGWIMGQAYNKSLNALNDLGLDIQIDQSLLDEANAILSTDLDAETVIDRQPQAPKRKRRNLIKDILNGKDLEPLVKDVIEKSFEENIDLIGTTEFRPKMLESFNAKLGPELKKILNTTPKFEDFIRTNFDYIYKALPQSTINKRYKEFAEQKLNEDGTPYRQTVDEVRGYNNMIENGFIEGKLISDVKSGPPKFIKKKITKREFAEYFVGKDIAPSKRGTRKTSLLGSVAEILADDLTFKTLSDPALIYKYQEGRQESVNNIIDKIKKDFGKDAEQDVIIKSSLSFPAQVNEINNFGEYVRGEAYVGKNINTIIEDYTKDQPKDVKDFLKPSIKKVKDNWKISGLDVSAKELKAIKDLEDLTPEGVDVDFDAYKNMNQFVNQENIELPNLMTENGESQYFGFMQDFTNTLDPRFVNLSIFGSTFGAGTIPTFSSPRDGNKARGITIEMLRKNFVLNNKIKDIDFNTKNATAFSASTLNNVERLIVEAGNPQTEQAQKQLADKINKFIKPEKRKAIQAARDYFYNKLNDYYQNASNKTLATANIARLLQLQSSLSSGIPRQGAVVTSVSLTPGYNKVVKGMFDLFQREHNIQNLNFNINILKSIIANNFNDLYPLYSAKYTQTILDSDVKIALDEGMITEDLIKKYPEFKAEDTGKTTFTEGFEIGMPSESMQILAGIPASSILDLETGLTLDKVIHNKIASKKALDALDAFTIRLKQDLFEQSKKAAENIFNNKNKNKIFKNPDNVESFNEMIIKSAKGEDVKSVMNWLSTKIDNNGNFVNLQKYNEAIIKDAKQPVDKFNTTEENLNELKNLDKKAEDARMKESKDADLNKEFNSILEETTGIGKEKQYGRAKAEVAGKGKGKFDLLGIPPSAQDFVGLMYKFIGKGKVGDRQLKWIKKNLTDPFARAQIDISNARVAMANDFKELKKILKISPKDLNKKIPGEPFTVGQAVRAYTWTQQGMDVPGLSKADLKELNDFVEADPNLVNFADQLIQINKSEGYPKPGDNWLGGTITTDLLTSLNTVVRAKYLKQWQSNVDQIFSEANLNKLEAAYGKGYRSALENILGRMKTGSNRGFKGDTLTGRFIDWINNSVGAIMFFNMRSAVLQTISSINFVNFSDNNPLKAAMAFGNQPQYWDDVMFLMNSDYLVERRNGLKINVSEADIAEIARESKNKAKAFVSKVLKLGFLPTQIADSFAIASGGATFYRNRVNSLLKEGMSQKDAETQAFQDFREISEESQQSSRPDRISAQQAGPMGRIILAFANTPAQYARLIQKAASDLKNGRGDAKTNISKILYYGMIQNVLFNSLQQALFALAFDDEEPEEETKNKKYIGIVNGMADSLLRGMGFAGAAVSTVKNAIMKIAEGKEAQDSATELLDISPPISSKLGKLRSAGRTWDWNKKEIFDKGWSLDNPAWLAIGQVVSATTNVPLDRGIRKITNLKDAADGENEEWQRIANVLGWQTWELEWNKPKETKSKIKVY